MVLLINTTLFQWYCWLIELYSYGFVDKSSPVLLQRRDHTVRVPPAPAHTHGRQDRHRHPSWSAIMYRVPYLFRKWVPFYDFKDSKLQIPSRLLCSDGASDLLRAKISHNKLCFLWAGWSFWMIGCFPVEIENNFSDKVSISMLKFFNKKPWAWIWIRIRINRTACFRTRIHFTSPCLTESWEEP